MKHARPVRTSPGAAPRVVAARVLDAVLHEGRSLKAELAASLGDLSDSRDRALVEAICYAVLRQPVRYDAALASWLPRPLGRRDRQLRALLMAGFAQIDPLGLAPHAAVAATVEATRVLGRSHQAGLVNALLRRALRDGLPAGEAHAQWPGWLKSRIADDWPADASAIMSASELAPPLWLRVNRTRAGRDAYLQRLADAGLAAEPFDGLPDAARLASGVPVAQLPGFAEGDASVQDGAAQLVADALGPPPGIRLLDACSAPGGKAAHLLERDPSLRLAAIDIDPARLQQVRQTLERLGLRDRASLLAADAADVDSWWDGEPFDAVLLDAPCSATGIIRRQPDVLLHRRDSDVAALCVLQARLLDALWKTIAPGGVLLYSTCSILKAENQGQVEAFLARTPGATAEPLDERFGRTAGPGRQRLPGEDGMDGFFYARLSKV
ncbi:16S rRNA (cytosine(967)-C(5))-methyltransferase RsmB [Novilysobacter spongiicola]|uniref:16S rRNA (cytosine(967)-C(5))-methyltransferase n=1 Tax=Lysobacter spongiicola DSM 21749 TaxID=1122188 RepID=A0A1T4PQT8_9GAMM|nr:16S rRNA (cytosine(967)-C(5))-methyltransferase RsmB [Lysobacter spongiicola]SJZ93656.1 16S rRNA (cytosine967-C5)-methyltransferase [Lysobacter spongiicola DSM 21749]